MRKTIISMAFVCLSFWTLVACSGQYGNEPTAQFAAIFEPGNISTGQEYGVTFSPDGSVIYFTRRSGIYWSKKGDSGWTVPQKANFSKSNWITDYVDGEANFEYFNWDPVISPDGSKLFIMSHGLVDGRIIDGENGDLDLWVVNREAQNFEGDTWGLPQHLGSAVNTPDHNEGALGIDAVSTIYFFSSGRDDSIGSSDVYVAALKDGNYLPAANMGSPINTEGWDGHVYADPGGEFLLYISDHNHPDAFGSCDIYVSWKIRSEWEDPINLGANVNTEKCELTPSLSRDGKTLFFARIEDGDTDERNIYSVNLVDTGFYSRRRYEEF